MVNGNGRPRALVTGASRGIGFGIAKRLAAEGYDLTLAARTESTLQRSADELRTLGVQVDALATDMADDGQVESLAKFQTSLGDRLDILVLAAGVGIAGDFAEYPMSQFNLQLAVNLRAPFRLVQLLLPALRNAASDSPNGAKVIAISSITGVISETGLAAYGATKAALISLCESITASEGVQGVTGTAISPGFVDTDMTAWMHDRLEPSQMISINDIAELAYALCRLSRHAAVPNIVVTRPGPQLWRA